MESNEGTTYVIIYSSLWVTNKVRMKGVALLRARRHIVHMHCSAKARSYTDDGPGRSHMVHSASSVPIVSFSVIVSMLDPW